ncbi:hypothetical protein LTR28_000522, partial [Elasticomyces elasticus]
MSASESASTNGGAAKPNAPVDSPLNNQQQQQQAPAAAPASAIDSLTCQWMGCGERCDSAEALYEHVCERHVGRKSTNNLNLTCAWGSCRTTTVKRDHITSHIRVHVPLKPHKCDFCGKAFKRPQDLKKHVKTHAEDTDSAFRSPEPNMRGQAHSAFQQGGKRESLLNRVQAAGRSVQSLKCIAPNIIITAASGYYTASHNAGGGMDYSSHNASHMAAANGNMYNNSMPSYAGYGSVNYPMNSGATQADLQTMDTRKRALEALNDFLGDIKRRAVNPTSYYDVSARLGAQALPLPVSTGYGYSTGNNYAGNGGHYNSTENLLDSFTNGMQTHGYSNGQGHGSTALQQQYSLPLPNARTKSDLQDIDRFLEQLQATVYESSNQAAAAG